MDKLREESRARYLQKRAEQKKEEEKGKLLDKKLLSKKGLLSEREEKQRKIEEEILKIAEKRGEKDDIIASSLLESTERGETVDERMKSAGELYKKQEKINPLLQRNKNWQEETMNKAFSASSSSNAKVFELHKSMDEYNDLEKEIEKQKLMMGESFSKIQESLPVFKYKDVILDTVNKYPVVIIVGDTGSGKSTQIPRYLLERSENESVICTQPRRVAAMSVAARVAEEMGVELGFEVGYTVRFDDTTNEKYTKLRYMTDGVLLREFLVDPLLSKYTTIMIDEAHERSIATDILLTLLKDLIKVRDDFRLIIASATIDAEKMSNYFDRCPIISIPGRRFKVEINYATKPIVDYQTAVIETVLKIHKNESLQQPCDILVFMTGQEEIEQAVEELQKAVRAGNFPNVEALPIYAALPAEKQAKIFMKTPPKTRKVIFATNIAETSLTIDNIKYVIDTGLVKEASYDPKSGCGSLDVVPISVSSAEQRAGRAGRITDGVCYRLYTQSAFQYEMPKSTSPELTRCDFAPTLLLLLSMGITTIVGFDFMDPPDAAHLRAAYEQLYALNAIDCEGNLTELGALIAQLPVSPMSAKTIISSFDFGCVDPILTICSILESGSPLFYIPKDKNKEAMTCIKQFWDPEGDHIALYNVYKEWEESEMSAEWCRSNYVQNRTLLTAHNIKQQLMDVCNVMNLHTDLIDDTFETISHCFSRGFFLNSAQLTTNGYYQTLKSKDEVKIHPGSSMHQYSPQIYVMFYEMALTKEKYIRTVMKLNPEWLIEASPNLFTHSNGEVIFRN